MRSRIAFYTFLCLQYFPVISFSQADFDFYLSQQGNDVFPGTSWALPKKTIGLAAQLFKSRALVSGTVKIGLKAGHSWDETLVTSYPVQVGSYSDGPGAPGFAILNGSKEFDTGWIKAQGTMRTFKQAIPYSGFTGYGIGSIGGYSQIYVIEVDRTLEKTAPFTARKPLIFLTDSAAVENTPGSYTIPVGANINPMPVFVHTSDGSPPNNHARYRYEVCVKDWAVNSTYQPNNNFENLWVRGFGAGIGMLPGGDNSRYNKIIFGPGAAIHHLMLRSGVINHSLFLPGPKNTNGYAVVFYDAEGLGRHCTIKNTMFLDIRTPLYAHTSGNGANYGAVELDKVVGFADTTAAGEFMFTSNTDTVLMNQVYAERYYCGYYYGSAKYASFNKCYFKDVYFGIAYSSKNPVVSVVNDVFIKATGNNPGAGVLMQHNTSLTLTNSVIHNASNGGVFLSTYAGEASKVTASGNIFVCDVDPSNVLTATTINTDNGVATSKDRYNNNVYVLLKGKGIIWNITNAATNNGRAEVNSFEEWKRQSGQDEKSLFFDLRNDARGLKAIFADPANGNYDLANTPEGRQIASLRAGMLDPINCFLQRPSYEAAAELIRNNEVLSVDGCRSPCIQNNIRVSADFNANATNQRQANIEWNIPEQANVSHYEIQRSSPISPFRSIARIAVTTDSSYLFKDELQPGVLYKYRLMIVSKYGGKCYSDTGSVITSTEDIFSIYPKNVKFK